MMRQCDPDVFRLVSTHLAEISAFMKPLEATMTKRPDHS